jgi:hypothetical protein
MLCGLVWAVLAWIGTMDPVYYSPVSVVDYASVASFSAALITLAACVWDLRVFPSRAVTVGGAAAAIGLSIAGVANLIEDGFGVGALGVAYVAGIVVGTFALIPTGVGLLLRNGTRWIALGPLVSFLGLILVAQWWGAAILATTWIALGALHGLGRLRLA